MEQQALELIPAITQMFSPQSTEDRGKIEKMLRSMTQDVPAFFHVVFWIFKSPDSKKISSQDKLAVSIFLKTQINNLLSGRMMPMQLRSDFFDQLFEVTLSGQQTHQVNA